MMSDTVSATPIRSLPATLTLWKILAASTGALLLAGCAEQPGRQIALGGSSYDPVLGVRASPRVVADGEAVPRGGGSYLVGHPYVIAGKSYYPNQRPNGYSVVGTASWYGDAFHGRRTANGEVFDKRSISAAHPTLPLPSYVRVTNVGNGRSMIVRVNDRGPYHGGRVMDVSQRVAEALDFRNAGTARIKVDYIGRAELAGSDDDRLMASLRTDGQMAQLDGYASHDATQVADNDAPAPRPIPTPQPVRVARLSTREEPQADQQARQEIEPEGRPAKGPLPPPRPFEMSRVSAMPARGGAKVAALEEAHHRLAWRAGPGN